MSSDRSVPPDERPASPSRRRGFAVAAAALGLFAAALLFEVSVRVALSVRFSESLEDIAPPPENENNATRHWMGTITRLVDDPNLVYRLRPGARGVFERHPLRLNSLGLRNEEVKTPKPKGVARVIALGDSYTFGWGVAARQAWPNMLEQALNSTNTSETRFEVVNMGTPTYNAVQEAELFHEIGLALEPDVVIWQANLNDALVPVFLVDHDFARSNRLYLTRLPEVISGALFRRENALLTFADVGRHNPEGGLMEMDAGSVPERYRHLVGLTALRDAYTRMATSCAERGIELLVMLPTDLIYEDYETTPDEPSLTHDKNYDPFRDLGAELGIDIIDTFAETRRFAMDRAMTSADLAIDYPMDLHPNPLRHALMARIAGHKLLDTFELGSDAAFSSLDEQIERLSAGLQTDSK